MKRNTKQLSKELKVRKKTGPKELHNERIDKITYNLAVKGKSNKEIYTLLGITEVTGIKWKKKYKTFYEAIAKGREDFRNNLVEKSLLKVATGFEAFTSKALVVSDGKDMGAHVEKVRVKEYYPPNVNAIKFFLVNRKSLLKNPETGWAEKQSVEHTGTLSYKVLADEEEEHNKE